MIAGTTPNPAAAYRVGHAQRAVRTVTRRTLNATWLVIGLVIVGLVVARYARAFGLLGIIAPVVVVIVILAILRAIGPTWIVRSRPTDPPPDPRNVTPREPPIPASSTIAPRQAPTHVVVVEPAPGAGEALASKLATLDRLRDDGRLSEAEYEAKRSQLIADF
jgi:hypothetical protein